MSLPYCNNKHIFLYGNKIKCRWKFESVNHYACGTEEILPIFLRNVLKKLSYN